MYGRLKIPITMWTDRAVPTEFLTVPEGTIVEVVKLSVIVYLKLGSEWRYAQELGKLDEVVDIL